MTEEEWRDIPNYEGLYQASTYGRVRSLDKYIRNGKNSERLRKGRILKLFKNKEGYVLVNLSRDNMIRCQKVHRLILITFDRQPKGIEEVNHKDGDKSNNHIGNLEWCTHSENEIHKRRILKRQIEEIHPMAKLNNNIVREIRIFLKEGRLTQVQIAKRFNVSQGLISYIKLNKLWVDVK